jgi:hypothetical protein
VNVLGVSEEFMQCRREFKLGNVLGVIEEFM